VSAEQKPQPEGERLHKLLARAGVASRRHSEELIRQGRVRVNGQVVTQMGYRVPSGATISVDGRPIQQITRRVYYALYKPPGYLSTARDEYGRPTVLHLVPSAERIYPVGRLDLDSEGLLLLTNDGELAQHLLHPRYEVAREYLALVQGHPTEEDLDRLRQGVELEDGRTSPAQVERVGSQGADTWLRVVIHEGRKRQVRRMAEAVGHPVRRLIRLRIGPVRVDNLKPGEWRELSPAEVESLRRVSGME